MDVSLNRDGAEERRPWWRSPKLRVVLMWALVVGAYQGYALHHGLGPVALLERLAATLRSGWGPLIYIGVYALLPLLLFPVTPLTMLGGWVFGPLWGVVYTIVGSNMSATVAYALGRWLGHERHIERMAARRLGRWLLRMRRDSFVSIVMLRLLFVPYDLVNYAAGWLRVRWHVFIAASALGALPGTLAIVLCGASITGSLSEGRPQLEPWTVGASLLILTLSLLLSRWLRRRTASAV